MPPRPPRLPQLCACQGNPLGLEWLSTSAFGLRNHPSQEYSLHDPQATWTHSEKVYVSQSVKPRPHRRGLVARIGSERGQEVDTSAPFSPAAEDRAGTTAGAVAWRWWCPNASCCALTGTAGVDTGQRGSSRRLSKLTLLHLPSCDGSTPAAAALQLWQARLPVRLRSS